VGKEEGCFKRRADRRQQKREVNANEYSETLTAKSLITGRRGKKQHPLDIVIDMIRLARHPCQLNCVTNNDERPPGNIRWIQWEGYDVFKGLLVVSKFGSASIIHGN